MWKQAGNLVFEGCANHSHREPKAKRKPSPWRRKDCFAPSGLAMTVAILLLQITLIYPAPSVLGIAGFKQEIVL